MQTLLTRKYNATTINHLPETNILAPETFEDWKMSFLLGENGLLTGVLCLLVSGRVHPASVVVNVLERRF